MQQDAIFFKIKIYYKLNNFDWVGTIFGQGKNRLLIFIVFNKREPLLRRYNMSFKEAVIFFSGLAT